MQPLNLTLDELREDSCRWPYGDGPFTFCGHPKKGGSSYCVTHHAMAFTRGSQRDVDRQATRTMGKIGAGGRMLSPGTW